MKNRNFKRNYPVIFLILAVALMSLIYIYRGHFFFYGDTPPEEESADQTEAPAATERPHPVRFIHLSEVIKGNKQEIFILEVDVTHPGVKIRPVLSSDLIYGFEYLTSMVERHKAFAAINGGFFTEFGLPSGMIVIDGEIATISTGRFPVFKISDGKAEISEINSRMYLKGTAGTLQINNLNRPAANNEVVAYTPLYGSSNRIQGNNITMVVRKDVVEEIIFSENSTAIPGDGFLVTMNGRDDADIDGLPFKPGDMVKLVHEPQLPPDMQAYECGSWIVKDGKVVIGDRDIWVGVLTNRDPRTAVGIKEDGTVVLIVVDGRQPGYSSGMTGKELGEFLAGYGVVNAAMLDGGASSEMIYDGKIVNRPSFKGQERPLAGGLLVMLENGR